MDYNVYSTDGTFPNQYGYLRIRYGANRGEYSAIFHDQIENILYTNLWRSGENKWSGWKQITTNSDLNNKLSIDRIIANCEEVQIDTDGWGHISFARELGNDWYIILFAYPPGWNFLTRNASKNGFDVQVLINETPVKEQKLWITWLAITP